MVRNEETGRFLGLFRRRVFRRVGGGLFPDREIIVRSGAGMRRIALPGRLLMGVVLFLAVILSWTVFTTDAYFEARGVYDDTPAEIAARRRMAAGLPRKLEGVRPSVDEQTILRAVEPRAGPDHWASARRSDLIAYASSLDHWVERARARNGRLAEALQSANTSLADLRDRKHATDTQNAALNRQLASLEAQFSRMRSLQRRLVLKVTDGASAEAARIEALIASTGIDIDRHLPDSAESELGKGGPFIPQGEEGPGREEVAFNAAVREAGQALDRVQRLKDLMRHLPLMAPVDYYTVSSAFGPRKDPINGRKAMHRGIDLRARYRTTIYAPAPGKVRFAGRFGRYGRFIEIDHGNGIVTRYGHLRQILVKRGAVVSARHRIGQVGNSGRSTGTHLHYEILVNGKAVDPAKFIEAGKHVYKG